jgi:ATP-dependent DNA helicase RecG
MDLEDVQRLASLGESAQLEFKRTTGERKEVAKTLCGMLNGRGGTVLIGVHDDGRIVGQQVNAATQVDIVAEIGRIEPAAMPSFEVIPFVGDRSVIALIVPGGGGPFMYEGRPYIRVGPTIRAMPKAQYDLLVLERLHGSHCWENQPARGVAPADLDAAEIRRTIDEAIRRGRMDDPGTRDTGELLRGLQTHPRRRGAERGDRPVREGARDCCQTTRSACCGCPASGAPTSASSSTTARTMATPSTS